MLSTANQDAKRFTQPANSFGRRESKMNNFVPITLRQQLDAFGLLSLAGMIAVGYVLLTFGPLP
jgi:hypothetical protein